MTNQHVMIVEDESIVAMDIQCKLEGLGYSVTAVVQSGEEAIQMAEQVKPDLILMDINLQGEMDGIAAASKILDHADIPVVYLTALRDADTVQRAKRTEPFGYVIKPFNEQELYAAIETSLTSIRCNYSGIVLTWNTTGRR